MANRSMYTDSQLVDIGHKLATLREQANVSQIVIAGDMDRKTVMSVEHGKCAPNLYL